MIPSSVKNIIFDLGGVIIDLSIPRTLQSFSSLSGKSVEEITRIFQASQEFLDFETGTINEKQFRDFIRNVYQVRATDAEIDSSWNQMLLTIPLAKLELLKRLKGRYHTYLLSNTNSIHLRHINEVVMPRASDQSLDSHFHEAYYSHELGMRKPDASIFNHVLVMNGLRADETLFLDDNKENVEAANRLGIKTVFVTSNEMLLSYFHE